MLRSRTAAALIILFSLTACEKKEAVPPDVIASVGDRQITRADFERYLERNVGSSADQLAPPAATALLDQYIDEVILSEQAAKKGIQFATTEITAAVRNDPGSTIVEKTDELRRQRLLADVTASVPSPEEAAVRRYYEENLNEFRVGDQVHARQILVLNEADAAKVMQELKSGKPFEEVSLQHSKAPNAASGGDIGLVARGQLPKAFEEVLFSLKPGQTSDVIRTNGNYFHVFKVESLRPAGTVALSTAAPLISTRLREEAGRKRLEELLSSAYKELEITVLAKRLPFPYTGKHDRASE
jgi:peptidyl-prolyl cis-trans isomerase C